MKHQVLKTEIMKKIVPILFLLLTQGASASAQTDSELKFSRVVLVGNVAQTVPAGKVWKVESALYNGGAPFCIATFTLGCGYTNGNRGVEGIMTFLVNGLSVPIPVVHNSNAFGQSSGILGSTPFPFWLPEGSTLQASTNVRYLSVLEFSVVP